MRPQCPRRHFLTTFSVALPITIVTGLVLGACAPLESTIDTTIDTTIKTRAPAKAVVDQYEIEPFTRRLRNFSLDHKRSVLASQGRQLFRISDVTGQTIPVREFQTRINAIHVMDNGAVVVATDSDHWDPLTPCEVWLSSDGAESFDRILSFTGGSALWWSITSDSRGVLYIGEYGPRDAQHSKRVVATDDAGRTWRTVFESPARDGSHIHRVAVDPFTDDLWVSVGDGRKHRGIFRRRAGDTAFEKVIDSQATGIAFSADAVWFGEDRPKRQGVSRLDRSTGKLGFDLNLDRIEEAGGSIYSLLVDAKGHVFAATMRYPGQDHRAYLWGREHQRWHIIKELESRLDGSAGSETIAGPDASGWFYVHGFRWRSRVDS